MDDAPTLTVVERFTAVAKITRDDDTATVLLEKLLDSAEAYFRLTLREELRAALSKADRVEKPEQSQRRDREACAVTLIADLKTLSRYLEMHYGQEMPVYGIFGKPVAVLDDLESVTQWVGALMTELYENRSL